MRKFPFFAALLLLLGACEAAVPYAIVDGAVVMGTEKTMADHVISLASGKNCSLVRIEKGLTYCEEDELTPVPNLYCYRELAGVTCYRKPDPRRGGIAGRLGDNEQNYVKKY